MEQGNKKNTAEVKTQKIKDPRRVEQGRRLAAISREARAKKARERESAKVREEGDLIDNANTLYLAVGAVAVGGLAYGAYRHLYTIKEEPAPTQSISQPEQQGVLSKKVPKLSTLD